MKKLNIENDDLMISYEEIYKNTEYNLKKILNFMELDINENLIKNSISESSVKNIKSDESQGKKIHKNIVLKGRNSFIRNPKRALTINERNKKYRIL